MTEDEVVIVTEEMAIDQEVTEAVEANPNRWLQDPHWSLGVRKGDEKGSFGSFAI